MRSAKLDGVDACALVTIAVSFDVAFWSFFLSPASHKVINASLFVKFCQLKLSNPLSGATVPAVRGRERRQKSFQRSGEVIIMFI